MTFADLLRPFEFEFFRNGLAVAVLAGALCGLVGVYVVLRGMSYIGHGLSHAVFGGFAASALLGVDVLLGAGVWGAASALMINGVTRRRVTPLIIMAAAKPQAPAPRKKLTPSRALAANPPKMAWDRPCPM